MPNPVPAAATGLPNSRRAVLRSILAAGAVASVPAAGAAASSAAVDPVFAAIERHKKARAASCEAFEEWPIERLRDYERNPRKNDPVVDKMVAAIEEFGFRIPPAWSAPCQT